MSTQSDSSLTNHPNAVSAPVQGGWVIAAGVFLGAFLLFQVQPLISRVLLPWFGGAPSVWTTCMLFFQCLLCGGYLYSHLLTTRIRQAWQPWIHLLLILLAVSTLQILPDESWKPVSGEAATGRILLVLARTVGMPYFLLSTTSPLLLRWYSLCFPERAVHRLYALSNAGSLLALISYPLLVEPLLPIGRQAGGWMIMFVIYGLLSVVVLLLIRGRRDAMESRGEPDPTAVSTSRVAWFLLSGLASVMLLAETNQICQDVAVVPFFWVVPLALYLLSFILCFESDRWYRRGLIAPVTAILVLAISLMQIFGTQLHLAVQLVIWSAGMFAIFMLCHGELARLRPEADQLTVFYLLSSAGGAAGGLSVAIIAPQLFPAYWEHDLGLLAVALLALAVWFQSRRWTGDGFRPPAGSLLAAILLLVVLITMSASAVDMTLSATESRRNFYGVLTVEEYEPEDAVILRHGRITHGMQFRRMQSVPATYYGYDSGVGRTLSVLRERADKDGAGLRIGLVGLGTGTLATYGRRGDELTFYEINSDVIDIAEEHFSFLRRCEAAVNVEAGDARLLLEFSEPQQFDLLVLDAFSGDSVPVHLLTAEAMQVYRRHLKSGGVLAFHISNIHFDLQPVTETLASTTGMSARTLQNLPRQLDSSGQSKLSDPGSVWTIMTANAEFFRHALLQRDQRPAASGHEILWTDDFANLLPLLKWAGKD
jgi:SAM-dependent methyltransferase